MEECVGIVLCVKEGARSLTKGATGLADLIYLVALNSLVSL